MSLSKKLLTWLNGNQINNWKKKISIELYLTNFHCRWEHPGEESMMILNRFGGERRVLSQVGLGWYSLKYWYYTRFRRRSWICRSPLLYYYLTTNTKAKQKHMYHGIIYHYQTKPLLSDEIFLHEQKQKHITGTWNVFARAMDYFFSSPCTSGYWKLRRTYHNKCIVWFTREECTFVFLFSFARH